MFVEASARAPSLISCSIVIPAQKPQSILCQIQIHVPYSSHLKALIP